MNISAKMLIERMLEFGGGGLVIEIREGGGQFHSIAVLLEKREGKTHTVIIDVKFVWSSWT